MAAGNTGRRTVNTVQLADYGLPGVMIEKVDGAGRRYWVWNPTGQAGDLSVTVYDDLADVKLNSWRLAPQLKRLHQHSTGSAVEIVLAPIKKDEQVD